MPRSTRRLRPLELVRNRFLKNPSRYKNCFQRWSKGLVAVMPADQTVVLPSTHQSFNLELPLREARDAFEKAYFEYHLAQESGSMTRVADKTGLERTHLYRKLKQLGLDLSKTKKSALV